MNIRELNEVAVKTAMAIEKKWPARKFLVPVARGGIPAAYAIAAASAGRLIVTGRTGQAALSAGSFGDMNVIVDDIYDSGRTLRPYLEFGWSCATLLAKEGAGDWNNLVWGQTHEGGWVTFPWEDKSGGEADGEESGGPEDAVVRLLEYMGLDPNSESMRETPRRFLGWLKDFRDGQEIGSNLTSFDGENYGNMVLVKNVPFVSLCEHHLLPFIGKASVAYIPGKGGPPDSRWTVRYGRWECCGVPEGAIHKQDCPLSMGRGTSAASTTHGRILGLSKLARIVTWRARRATVQERLTNEIADEVAVAAATQSVAVVVEAEHMCVSLRGARALGSTTVTSAMRGAFMQNPQTRAEFLDLAGRR